MASDALKIVACRLPHTLIAEAQRHADLYHTSVSELLRQGLEYRLVCKTWPPAPQAPAHGIPPHAMVLLADLAQHLLHVQQELWALPGHDSASSHGSTAAGNGTHHAHEPLTDVLASPEDALQDDIRSVENMPLYYSNTIEDETLSPGGNSPVETEMYNRNTMEEDEQSDTAQIACDPARYQLGTLCKRGHAYGNTGQSLRELRRGKVTECVECHRERARTSQARRLAKQGASQ